MESFFFILIIVIYFIFRQTKRKNDEISSSKNKIKAAEDFVNSIDELLYSIDAESTTKTIRDSGKVYLNQESVDLYEPRARRVSGHTGVRVAKGVYIGGSSAKSHQEQTLLSTGNLTLNVDELIYSSALETRTIKVVNIVETELFSDGIRISIKNRQKPVLFTNITNSLTWSECIDGLQNFIQEFNKGKWDKSFIKEYIDKRKSIYTQLIAEEKDILNSLESKNANKN
ncbi:hypothetical protein OA181_03590 [Acidimicrobiaceae bacterium]|nr:hypothetical protein [Acidimicrobiaceae bacterium]